MIAALLLMFASVAYRIAFATPGIHDAGWISNFTPVAAIAFCGAFYLPKRTALIVSLTILFVTDLAVYSRYGVAVVNWLLLPLYIALVLVEGVGLALRYRVKLSVLLCDCVAASLF